MTPKRKPTLIVPASGRLYHFGWAGGGPVHPKVREANRRRARSWKAGFKVG